MTKKKKSSNFIKLLKSYLGYKYFYITSVSILIIYLFFYLFNLLQLKKEMLLWLFSTTSQSMAALFAVVGMFAVFRLHALEAELNDYRNVLKNKFRDANLDVDGWRYKEILRNAGKQLKIAQKRHRRGDFPLPIIKDLKCRIDEISVSEKIKNGVLYSMLIPMAAILITFLFSIFSIPLTETISINFSRYTFFLTTTILVTFSLTSIYKFFKFSMNPEW